MEEIIVYCSVQKKEFYATLVKLEDGRLARLSEKNKKKNIKVGDKLKVKIIEDSKNGVTVAIAEKKRKEKKKNQKKVDFHSLLDHYLTESASKLETIQRRQSIKLGKNRWDLKPRKTKRH